MSPVRTPEEVIEAIMATGPRPQKVKNLQALQQVCKALYEAGPRDFSLVNIGRLCEAKGIMKARGLYNAAANDYRLLITAWASRAGPPPAEIAKNERVADAYVDRIQDPVIRMLIRRDLAKLTRVTSELNVLKSTTTLKIDRRLSDPSAPGQSSALKGLEDFELRAIKKSLSAEFLRRKGWEETKLGEIVSEAGRTIFDPGFATGLRKLLGE